jgi:hypothetical protein
MNFLLVAYDTNAQHILKELVLSLVILMLSLYRWKSLKVFRYCILSVTFIMDFHGNSL